MPLSLINGYHLSKDNFLARVTFKAGIETFVACVKSSRYQIITCKKTSSDWHILFALKCVFSIG